MMAITRRIATYLAAFWLVQLVFAAPVGAAAGELDPEFGVAGKVLTHLGGLKENIHALAVQVDGKTIAVGHTVTTNDDSTQDKAWFIARYDVNGQLDATFDGDGYFVWDITTGDDSAEDVALIVDDGVEKILVTGIVDRDRSSGCQPISACLSGNEDFYLARFLPDGTRDTSFGNGGAVITDFGTAPEGRSDLATSIVTVGPNVVVGGWTVDPSTGEDFALAWYKSNGDLDSYFGGDGKVTTDLGSTPLLAIDDRITDLTVFPDPPSRGIVVAGTSGINEDHDFALAVYDHDGDLRQTTTAELGGDDHAYDLAYRQVDGELQDRVVVAGESCNLDRDCPMVLAQYVAPTLAPDASFGTGGLVVTKEVEGQPTFGKNSAVAYLNNGKVLAAANVLTPSTGTDFGLFRYTAQGVLDPTFGGDGAVTTDLAGSHDNPSDVVLMDDGRIVAGGNAINPSTDTVQDLALVRYLADPPPNSLSISNATAYEAEASSTAKAKAIFTVSLSEPSLETVEVNYGISPPPENNSSYAESSDYESIAGKLTFLPLETKKEIHVPIEHDDIAEGDEIFEVFLSQPINASIHQGQATGTIVDDDVSVIGMTGPADAVEESAESIPFTLTLSKPNKFDVEVSYKTRDISYRTTDTTITATPGEDYTAEDNGSVTFGQGETQKTISVAIADDPVAEKLEEFEVWVSGGKGTDGTYEIPEQGLRAASAIKDNDISEISIEGADIDEGHSDTTTITLPVALNKANSRDVTVGYATSAGTAKANDDYESATGTVHIPAGEKSGIVKLRVKGDTLDEDDETFIVKLSSPSPDNAVLTNSDAVVTVKDNDPLPTIAIANAEATEGGEAMFTVTLTPGSGRRVVVDFATSNGTAMAGDDYRSQAGTLIFEPGQTTKSIGVSTFDDSLAEGDETFFLNLIKLTNAQSAGGIGVGTIVANDGGNEGGGGGGGGLTPLDARTIECVPEFASSPVGGEHTVTCAIKNRDGGAVAGEGVVFSSSGTGILKTPAETTTDSRGLATTTVTSSEPGDQVITATLSDDLTGSEPDEVDECDKPAGDPEGAPSGACSDSVTQTWSEQSPTAAARRATLNGPTNPVKFDRRFTLNGNVESTDPGCLAGVEVIILKDAAGDNEQFIELGRVETDASGIYSLSLIADRSGSYAARLIATEACGDAISNVRDVLVRKAVKLTVTKKRTEKGKRVRVNVTVLPCEGHDGETVVLRKKANGAFRKIAEGSLNNRCKAVFKTKITKNARFKAVSPKQDEDHEKGVSAVKAVRVR